MDLYAGWVEGYHVTFHGNGGYFWGDETTWATEAAKGATWLRNNPGEPEQEGYAFMGWYLYADGSGNKVNPWAYEPTYTEDITFYAKWAESIQVTFDANGGRFSDETTEKAVEVANGTAIPEAEMPTEPTREGYTFSGWSGLPSTMPDRNVEVTGIFIKDKEYVTQLIARMKDRVAFVESRKTVKGGFDELPEEAEEALERVVKEAETLA